MTNPGFPARFENNLDLWDNVEWMTKMTEVIRTRKEFEPIIRELNSELKKKYDDFLAELGSDGMDF